MPREKLNKGFIYRLISPSEKSYIGFCSIHPWERWKQHIRNAKNGAKTKLYTAMRKYGSKEFIVEVLCSSDNINYCREKLEDFYIKLFDSINNGYNHKNGGDGMPGFKFSKESRALMSQRAKEGWEQGKFARKYTPERLEKRRANPGLVFNWLITFPDGHQEKIWNLRGFCRKIGIRYSNLHGTSLGNIKSARGYSALKLQESF